MIVYAALEKDCTVYSFFVASWKIKGFEYDSYKYKSQVPQGSLLLITEVIALTELALDQIRLHLNLLDVSFKELRKQSNVTMEQVHEVTSKPVDHCNYCPEHSVSYCKGAGICDGRNSCDALFQYCLLD